MIPDNHPFNTNPFWYEYADLARLARHLLAQRENHYPALVYAKQMTQAHADAAIHNMAATAQLMHAMIGYSRIGTLPAKRWHIEADLITAATRARAMADKKPDSGAHQDTADGVAAMAHWLGPWDGKTRYTNTSRAQHIHGLNIALRAQADEARSREGIAA